MTVVQWLGSFFHAEPAIKSETDLPSKGMKFSAGVMPPEAKELRERFLGMTDAEQEPRTSLHGRMQSGGG